MNEQLMNIRLVQEVEKHPCLFNYKLAEYSRKDVTEKAWNEVGSAVNLTESLAKEKWRNLRTVFSRYLKPAPSGSAKAKKPYYLAEVMHFAIPFIKGSISASSGNLASIKGIQKQIPASYGSAAHLQQCQTQISLEAEDCHEVVSSAVFTLEERELDFPTTGTSAQKESSQKQPQLPSPNTTPPIRKRKSRSTLSEVDNSFMEYFKAKKAKLDGASTSKMPMEMFLLSLLPEIEAMNGLQKVAFKRRMLVLIDDIVHPVVTQAPPPSYTITPQDPTIKYARSDVNTDFDEKTEYEFEKDILIDDGIAYQEYEESDDCTFIQ